MFQLQQSHHQGFKVMLTLTFTVPASDSHTNKTPIPKTGHGQQYLYTNQLQAMFNYF
jgi:hypothetical protein